MSDAVVSLIRKALGPTGADSFEGLVGALLGSLTGKRFRLARSGTQGGRDLTTDALEATVIAVECKRYGDTRELDEGDLLGKLNQAVLDIPDLDLWILAASRPVSAQLQQLLVRAGRKDGVEVRFVETGDGPPSSLVLLLAHAPDIVLRYVAGKVTTGQQRSIQSDLESLAHMSGLPTAVQRLRDSFSDASLGYDHWRRALNQALMDTFASARASRARLGQVVRVSTMEPSVVGRGACLGALDSWYSNWPQAHKPIVVLGEEGDGKTWAIADWIARRQASASFPPVVLLNSRDVNSTQPLDLLAHAASSQLGGSTEAWARRLRRWCRPQEDPSPTILLVLDGLDERHSLDWRALLDVLAAGAWRQRVAVALTCRTSFWRRRLEALRYLEVVQHVVEPFSDAELDTALERRGLRSSDLPDNLLSLLRKPRHLDLVLKMRERLAQSGDVSRQRLLYEDWKDRYARKAASLDDHSFQDILMDLARRARTGEKRYSAETVTSALPPGAQRDAALVELSTGGILVESQGRFVVQEDRLLLGMGLLLAEEVREALAAAVPPEDRIEQWLEPEPGMDLKGKVLEAAAIHALSTSGFPLEAIVCLLWAWARAQNAAGREDSFPGYMPLRPDAYLELAERAWADDEFQPVLHSLLRSAFIRFRDSAAVRPEIVARFHRWLGFVHPAGFSALFGIGEAEADQQRAKIEVRLGRPLSTGPLDVAGHQLAVIDEAGLLRLGRLALGVISCGERSPFIRAIAAGVVAEAVMAFPEKGESVAWVLRSSPDPVEQAVLSEAAALATAGGAIAEKAAYRLLDYVGTAAAYELRDRLPQPPPTVNDPCRSHFPWLPEHSLRCLETAGLDTGQAVRALSRAALDPALSPPASFRAELGLLVPALLKDSLWSNTSLAVEDHAIESMEPTVCAFAPEALASLFRQAASWFSTREGLSLRTLAWGLREHVLVFREEEWRVLAAGWEKLLSREWVGEIRHAEEALFGMLLNGLASADQLRCLVRRPVSASDYVSYEDLFAGPPDWADVRQLLEAEQPVQTLFRILWFVAPVARSIPEDVLDTIAAFRTHPDSWLRGAVFAVFHRSGVARHIRAFLESDWRAAAAQHPLERHWGSWLWIDHARDRPFEELRDRVAEDLWGDAVEARGYRPEDVRVYAGSFHSFPWLSAPPALLPPFAVRREAAADPRQPTPVDVRIQSEPSTFVTRGHSWGDSPAADGDALARVFDLDGRVAADLHARRSVVAADEEQRRGGNPWFLAGPPASALDAVIGLRPDLVAGWLDGVLAEPHGDLRLMQHAGFFQELCVALLRTLPTAGIRLHERLLEVRGLGLVHYAEIGVLMIDDALWTAPSVPDIEKARWRSIRRATSDLDLSRVALAAEYRGQGAWLLSEIQRALSADSLLDRARAITLLGVMCDSRVDDIVDSRSHDKEPDWVDEALTLARERRKASRLSQHWFARFAAEDDDVKAWAAFRLFLCCVDRRYWVWSPTAAGDASLDFYTPRRRRFLRFERRVIERHIERNEASWKRVFLGTRVMEGQVAPWMS